MKQITGILFFVFAAIAAFAQKAEQPLVQFSGVVHNADSSNVIVPYVTVTNVSYRNQTNIANYKGYFSFVAHERDTIKFTCVGYEPQTMVIPDNVGKSYTVQVSLHPQTIHLPMVRVFPWATTDEFKKDFLTMKIADDDLENARKNLSHAAMSAEMNVLARDAQEIQSFNAQQMHMNLVNSHSLTPNPLLNPIAWGSLIKEITDGDKSRSGGSN